MLKKSTIQHLRFPFSIFLLPFYLFALSNSKAINIVMALSSFFIIHFIFNPASNGYNSFYDKDEDSIGGVKKPLQVTGELYRVSMLLHLLAIIGALVTNLLFGIGIIIITIVSMMYSHPKIRLKKLPIIGLFAVSLFQGAWTYIISYIAINNIVNLEQIPNHIILPSTLCSLILLGSYPMTQIYQHEEDRKRGDITFSVLLGEGNTFVWTAFVFFITMIGFGLFYFNNNTFYQFYLLNIYLMPTLLFFGWWYIKSRKFPELVNYDNTMTLNKISSIGFILFFITLLVINNL